MLQIQLNFWNGFKRIFCYYTGLRKIAEKRVTSWKKYDRLTDIPINELKKNIKEDNIKLLLIDMDGTLKYYKKGLIKENKEWVNKIKPYVDICVISNANKELTSKVANELEVKYVHKAKKPSSYGFQKAIDEFKCKNKEVIMIGDAVRADIIGAQKFGIDRTILLKDLNIIGLKNSK